MSKGYPSFENYIRIKEAAKQLGCSQSRVRVLCRDGIVIGKKMGDTWYIELSSLQNASIYMQRMRSGKQILLSKLRKKEIESLKSQPRRRRKLTGIEINLRYE